MKVSSAVVRPDADEPPLAGKLQMMEVEFAINAKSRTKPVIRRNEEVKMHTFTHQYYRRRCQHCAMRRARAVCIYIYIYIYICVCTHNIYIYIYI